MGTTTLFAELVVVGTGTAIFIVLLFYSFFGDLTWFSKLDDLSLLESITSLIPVLSIIYLLGIVVNNLGYLIFINLEKCLRKKKFNNNENENKYNMIRNNLYISSSENMINDFEFRRSKVRICRGWFVNSILIIVALFLFMRNQEINNSMVWFWIAAFLLLMVSTAISWWVTTDTELELLKSYDNNKENSKKRTQT